MGVRLDEMVGNCTMADLYMALTLDPVQITIWRQQLLYIGRVLTRDEHRLEKTLLFGTYAG